MLADLQQSILDVVEGFEREAKRGPTIDEVAQALGKNWNTIRYHISNLQALGRVDFTPGQKHKPGLITLAKNSLLGCKVRIVEDVIYEESEMCLLAGRKGKIILLCNDDQMLVDFGISTLARVPVNSPLVEVCHAV